MTTVERKKRELVNIAKENKHTLARFINFGGCSKSYCVTCGVSVDTKSDNKELCIECESPEFKQYILIADTTHQIGVRMPVSHVPTYKEIMKVVRMNGGTELFSYELSPQTIKAIQYFNLGE